MNDKGREEKEGADFGTSERATRSSDRDFDDAGESKDQDHGHTTEK